MTKVQATAAHRAASSNQDAVAWIHDNAVKICAAALIVAQLWLKASALSHAYFRQDDFVLFDWSLGTHLNLGFMMTVYGGHLMPGGLAYAWFLSRMSLYDWTLASILALAFIAASSVALFRLLRTIFGERPAILIPLMVYVFSPLMLPGLSFWSTTLQWLPTQLAIFMALNAHIMYVRTERLWHAAATFGWIVFGMLFDDVAALIPLLCFALTSAFFAAGGWPRAVVGVARRYWKGWALYGVLLVGYVVAFVHQLPTSGQQPVKPGLFSNVLSFTSELVRISFVPAALGGPWRWNSLGSYAVAAEVSVLVYLAWAVAGLVVLASVWFRRRALRAWLILAAWVLLSAVIPPLIGRVGIGANPTLLGSDLHYLTDSLPVLAVCLALAFWPVEGEADAYRAKAPQRVQRAGTFAVMTFFVVGSLWSYHAYGTVADGTAARSYIATARVAVAGAPKGAVIVDEPVPENIEVYDFFLKYAYTSKVIGALAQALPGQHLTWTATPSGVYRNLMVFDGLGRLWQAAVYGRSSTPPLARQQGTQAPGKHQGAAALGKTRKPAVTQACWNVGAVPFRIRIPGAPLYRWPWMLDLTYTGPASTLEVTFGGRAHLLSLPAGTHDVFVPATGGGRAIFAQVISGGPAVCITRMVIGGFVPSILSHPIPAVAVRG